MRNKKVVIGIIVLLCVLVLGWGKYNELQKERRIQAVQKMQHPNYGSVTFDWALQNYFGNIPDYLHGSNDTVMMQITDKNFGTLIMTFTVDLKDDVEYLNSCYWDGYALSEQEAYDVLNEIYSRSSRIQGQDYLYDSMSSMSSTVSDFMSATVNGTAYDFELESAVLRNGNMQVTYVCYNPRGEELYSVTLYFDDNIQTGQYSSASGDTEFRIMSGRLIAQSEKTGSMLGGTVPVQEGVGSFSLDLTYQSDDWTTYEGTFSATLGRSSLSGSYGDSSMTIEDAKFNFTLQ